MILKTQWIHHNQIAILKGNTVVAAPKVLYFKDRDKFLETQGNFKTRGIFGMINNISNGCFRGCTGFEKCETPCYEKCYANESVYAYKNKYKGFNICYNGVNNDFFHCYLPENNNYKLNTLKFWRIGSESSDMSLALALDIVEPWLKENPDKFFTGISSDYFFVDAKKLKKLSKYNNIIVGHSVSIWFSEDELKNRIQQIQRYNHYGVPTVVWIVTNNEWIDNNKNNLEKQQKLIKKILNIVTPQQIIEIPFHNKKYHAKPMLNLNPLGACCDTNDHKCKSCKVLCGIPFLIKIKKLKENHLL